MKKFEQFVKDFIKEQRSNDPDDMFARDSYGNRAAGVKKLKDGTYRAVNDDGEYKIFRNKDAAEKHAHGSNKKKEK